MNRPSSHPLSNPIAIGRTAEVFAWQDGTILKLYRDWCPPHWVEYEIKIARAVSRAGLPVPGVVGDIVEVDGRRGMVYERLEGLSMLEKMKTSPWNLWRFARLLAELHVRIHSLSLPELPPQRPALEKSIQKAEHLPEDLRARALEALAHLPDDTRPCHGDLHPGNVIMSRHGPIVIDWMTATCGNPFADVARTNMLLTIGAAAAGPQVPWPLRLASAWYQSAYQRRYLSLNPDSAGQLARWKAVMAAARLNEDIVPERAMLLRWIEAGLE